MFDMYDEKGSLIHLIQNKKAWTIPAVYGVFGGASSPNNSMPIDVPDTCFLAHDSDYALSYFNWESDMKLVSRLVQRRADWPLDSVSQLNSIVIYFATVGASLAVIKGSIVGDPSVAPVVDEIKDDIFYQVVATPDMKDLKPVEYAQVRYLFYNELNTKLESNHKTSGIMGTNNARQLLNKINIQIL